METKYRKAMVSNAQLDNENNNLMYQVDTLKDLLIELEELLSESRREYEEKVKVWHAVICNYVFPVTCCHYYVRAYFEVLSASFIGGLVILGHRKRASTNRRGFVICSGAALLHPTQGVLNLCWVEWNLEDYQSSQCLHSPLDSSRRYLRALHVGSVLALLCLESV